MQSHRHEHDWMFLNLWHVRLYWLRTAIRQEGRWYLLCRDVLHWQSPHIWKDEKGHITIQTQALQRVVLMNSWCEEFQQSIQIPSSYAEYMYNGETRTGGALSRQQTFFWN